MKSATAGVIWDQDQVLIAKRRKDQYWEFPGGKIEPGESAQECLIREIREELSISIRIEEYLARIQGRFRGRDMDLHAFHAVWVAGDLDLSVHTEVRRINPLELPQYRFIHEDREIVKIIKP
ncbi:MAG: NUDIX domain-containing protein [Candidatus Omnitrophica bacterium]|nr:NUDIX domain-containing protein [Candidatus Omnitrophota bacterium]